MESQIDPRTVPVTARLTEATRDALDARRGNTPRSEYIAAIIAEHLWPEAEAADLEPQPTTLHIC